MLPYSHHETARNPEWKNLLEFYEKDGREQKRLKPEVIHWLETNVKDRNNPEQPKGWCIGDEEYLKNDILNLDIFFHRQKDAFAFARQFAKHKTFDSYFDYFREIRKKYCPIKKKLIKENKRK